MDLPNAFRTEMEDLWEQTDAPGELNDFLTSFEREASRALLLNTLKIRNANELPETVQRHLHPVPWCDIGYFYDESWPASSEMAYKMGLYYLQDPSAMLPAQAARALPGERVLDMCAAPGGKSFRICGDLQGKGILWANEKVEKRGRALTRNLEMSGCSNAVISCADGLDLPRFFDHFFDLIVIDAPCSGSAMFRKDKRALKSWEEYRGSELLKIQADLLDSAVDMLRPGGRIVYSTCSFSWNEDEGQAEAFLNRHPDFNMKTIQLPGCDKGLARKNGFDGSAAARIWPHRSEGEGQFAVCFVHEGGPAGAAVQYRHERPEREIREAFTFFVRSFLKEDHPLTAELLCEERLRVQGETLHYLNRDIYLPKGLRLFKSGLFLGTLKKAKHKCVFRPAHAFLQAMPDDIMKYQLRLRRGAVLAEYLLRGDTPTARHIEDALEQGMAETSSELHQQGFLSAFEAPSGAFIGVMADGHPLCLLKKDGQRFKNEYPPGWIPG